MKLKLQSLVGKTIAKLQVLENFNISEYDDERHLEIFFTDGTKCVIEAYYGKWTGISEGANPILLRVVDTVHGFSAAWVSPQE